MQVPAYVEYEKATSVEHALALLARFGPEARILAGGHSLIPMMKLRLVQPETLIDINGLSELSYIDVAGGELRIGALTRHAELLDSAVAGERFAILHDAERVIADPVVRNWGTIGGSLCQADPSEDLSGTFAALKASMIIRGPDGSRTVSAREFHTGPYETVVAPGEMLTEISIVIRPGCGSAYEKVGRRVGDWPIGAAAAVVWLDGAGRPGEGGPRGENSRGRARPHRGRRPELRRGRGGGVSAWCPGGRGNLRRGGQDRCRKLQPGLGSARARRLQTSPRQGAHRAGAAPRGTPGRDPAGTAMIEESSCRSR